MFGLLNINKPAGLTSRDVVTRLQYRIRPIKTGHAGTLDPLASGVLVVCVGRATRLVPYVQAQRKVYRATFLLGQTSPSHDLETPVEVVTAAPAVTRADLLAVLPEFQGTIQQTPPLHSAVKVEGRRAYKLARRGKTTELRPRAVEIHRIELIDFAPDAIRLEIECGSGTYIRSLARDLGDRLGCGAVMSELQRTQVGGFRIDDAITMQQVDEDDLAHHLHPAARAVADREQVTIDDAAALELAYGRPIAVPAGELGASTAETAVVDGRGELLALGRRQAGSFHPSQVFITPDDLHGAK